MLEYVLDAQVAETRDPVIVTHRRADRDAVGAAVGLAGLLESPATICLPAGATADAQPLLKDYETVDNADQLPHDVMIVVDAPSTDRIAPVQVLTPLFLFDHRPPGDLESLANTALVDEDAGSTSELVYRVARTSSWDVSPAAAIALVTGVLDDTDHLHDAGATQVEHVGGHEGAAARALRAVGVDCALVWSQQGDGVRVVGRCTEAFAERLPLGTDLLPGLVRDESASAGGHPTAGTAKLPETSPEVMPERLVRAVEDGLGLHFGVVD